MVVLGIALGVPSLNPRPRPSTRHQSPQGAPTPSVALLIGGFLGSLSARNLRSPTSSLTHGCRWMGAPDLDVPRSLHSSHGAALPCRLALWPGPGRHAHRSPAAAGGAVQQDHRVRPGAGGAIARSHPHRDRRQERQPGVDARRRRAEGGVRPLGHRQRPRPRAVDRRMVEREGAGGGKPGAATWPCCISRPASTPRSARAPRPWSASGSSPSAPSTRSSSGGVVLGFELVSGHPKMILNLRQAKKQEVVLRAAIIKLMRIVE